MAAAFIAVAGCTSGDDEDGSASAESTAPASGGRPHRGRAPPAAPAATQLRLLRLGSFDQPTYLTAPRGDRRRFVVERPGRIRVVSGGRVLGTPFLDIADLVTTGGESGLLSMAFAPDYARSGRFYVYYTDSDGYIRIDQFRRAAGRPEPRRPRLAPAGDARAAPALQPQGRPAAVRPRREALRGLRGRRRGRRPGPERRRTSAPSSAS